MILFVKTERYLNVTSILYDAMGDQNHDDIFGLQEILKTIDDLELCV